MATVPLREVVAAAHSALEAGDHTQALAACHHILAHYPYFADIHRLSGEIFLEQGNTEAARRAFEQALSYDPQNVLASLGLGVIAEETLDIASAAAHFQRALETDPTLTQLRDELVRLYSKIYGQGGRLHVSGAGLAGYYARGNHLSMARQQYETMLNQQPHRVDLVLALAEVRWRQGDDAGAQQLCQQVLAQQPRTLRALYIQADLYRRHGATERAREAFAEAVAIDPLGTVLEQLREANPAGMFEAFVGAPAEIPAFEAAAITAAVESQPITNSALGVSAMSEDVEWQRVAFEIGQVAASPDAPTADSESFEWPWENRRSAPVSEPANLDTPMQVEPPVTPAATEINGHGRGITETLREIDALGFKPFAVDATEPDDLAALDMSAAADEPASTMASAEAASATDAAAALQELVGNWDQIDQELAAATPRELDSSVDAMVVEMGLAGVTPFAADGDDDGGSWDDLDMTLPAAQTQGGFTGELNRLDEEGLEPFSFEDLDVASGSPSADPLSDLELTPTVDTGLSSAASLPESTMTWADLEAAMTQVAADSDEAPSSFADHLGSLDDAAPMEAAPFAAADAMAGNLEASLGLAPLAAQPPADLPPSPSAFDEPEPLLDPELRQAVPATGSLPSGFTEELRALDEAGMVPFTLEESATAQSAGAPSTPSTDYETSLGLPPLFAQPAVEEPALGDEPSNAAIVSGDTELRQALPGPTSLLRGFTEELRSLDELGVTPFTLEEQAAAAASVAAAAPSEPAVPSDDAAGLPWMGDIPDDQDWGVSVAPVETPEEQPAVGEPVAATETVVSATWPTTGPFREDSMIEALRLDGSLFDTLRARKRHLIEGGALVPRERAAAPASSGQALGQAEAAVDDQPADQVARLRLAQEYAEAGRAVDAAICYRLLLRSAPDLLSDLAQPIEALAASHHDEPRVAHLLGDLYMRQGRYGQALSIYKSLLLNGARA